MWVLGESAGRKHWWDDNNPIFQRSLERYSDCTTYAQGLILEITWILWQRPDRRLSFIDDPMRWVVHGFPYVASSEPTGPDVELAPSSGKCGTCGAAGTQEVVRSLVAPGNFHRSFELAPRAF